MRLVGLTLALLLLTNPALAGYADRYPVMGDFDGNGVMDFGWVDDTTFQWLIVVNGDVPHELFFTWGAPGLDVPVVGQPFPHSTEWAIGVYRNSTDTWYWFNPVNGHRLTCTYGVCQ